MAATIVPIASLVSVHPSLSSSISRTKFHKFHLKFTPTSSSSISKTLCCSSNSRNGFGIAACLDPSSSSASPRTNFNGSTKLYVSGLSFRTTQESLRNAFENFGKLIEVNLVMDRIANRPRGFAFLRYATEEESKAAIEGMHGKFLDGRVIFVEVARPRSELRQRQNQDPRPFGVE